MDYEQLNVNFHGLKLNFRGFRGLIMAEVLPAPDLVQEDDNEDLRPEN